MNEKDKAIILDLCHAAFDVRLDLAEAAEQACFGAGNAPQHDREYQKRYDKLEVQCYEEAHAYTAIGYIAGKAEGFMAGLAAFANLDNVTLARLLTDKEFVEEWLAR